MTTLATLTQLAANRFADPNFNVWTQDNWCDYVNQAYQKVNGSTPLWPWLEAQNALCSFDVGDRELALPDTGYATTYQVHFAYDCTHDEPLRPDMQRGHTWHSGQQLNSTTGMIQTYRVVNNCLALYPLTDEAVTVMLEYVAYPAPMGCDDSPAFAYDHEMLIDGAAALAYLDDGNMDQYNARWAKFEQSIKDMINSQLAFRTETYQEIMDSWWM